MDRPVEMSSCSWNCSFGLQIVKPGLESTVGSEMESVEYYADVLDHVWIAVIARRYGSLRVCCSSMSILLDLHFIAVDGVDCDGFRVLPPWPYSLDQTPSDYFLLPNLEKELHNCHYQPNDAFQIAVQTWFYELFRWNRNHDAENLKVQLS